ncbi:hypothetical protein P170DRAFT_500420 [Aspergillus steynii IBT 23096]|uniref:C2H2-type domain-containing protein n=1 Tax=Aspergillus steynii IBT 23096 TaxID=1392250 RepID=A0A2I2FYR8_9EURO|nr:uncharacterized protein P170DRAFT_500420 [Aspergillus steynii IBT 23096]PLB45769.1 hypothetical protein P170DRAFT_500420 [Aspergillus steynii IBT 23096]
MFAQYTMSPNLPTCPPMEHSYSASSEDSMQSSLPLYYNYPPSADFELISQPTSSPSYAPSYASSSFSASSYGSPAFSSCDFTPPLAYPAQQMQATNATYFAPLQPYCPWTADPTATADVAANPMAPMDEMMIPDLHTEADMDQLEFEPEMEMEMEQPYPISSPKPMTDLPISMPVPMSIPTDLHACPNAGSKPFPCADCGRAFTRPADLKRHQSSVHNPVFQDCPVEECLRKDSNGFPRRDHLIEHLRSYHHWDVPKRRAVRRGMKAT